MAEHTSAHAFVALLKSCAHQGDLQTGSRVHAEVARKGLLAKDVFVGSALVNMYCKCGSLAKAQQVFDTLSLRNVVSWNALIAGYSQHGCGENALGAFVQMQLEGVPPDALTFVSVFKACGSIAAADKGCEIHAEIARSGLVERDVSVGNSLLNMYAKCGVILKAQEVFDELPVRDTVSWNALIAGYCQHGCGDEALNCFRRMQLEGISPDAVTYASILKACGGLGATEKGQIIHAEIARRGLLETDIFLGNAMLDMYVKCGLLTKAQEVFDRLPFPDTVSWNALIAGYSQSGCGNEALNSFAQMQLEGASPDKFTYVCVLKACGSIGAAYKGQEIHAEIGRIGLLETDVFLGNTLVDMYAKCGLLSKAQQVFDKLLVRDKISWNALISGYVQHEHFDEALKCFRRMQLESVAPDAATFVCILKSCGGLGATDKGQEIHAEIARAGLVARDIFVGNALIDMYAKCGALAKAQEAFDKLPIRNTVSWNALITGYSQFAKAENVFHIFDRMIGEGTKPTLVTFMGLLNACSHTGLVIRGLMYLESMHKTFGIEPTSELYTCMIDILGRAGQLDKAVTMIEEMPFHADLVVWRSVLGACRKWGNVEIGRHAFEHAVHLDEKDPAAYVFMSNIYSDAGLQDEADEVEALRVKKQAWQKPGHCWWTDVKGIVHLFYECDKGQLRSESMGGKLELFEMRQEAYCSHSLWMPEDLCENST